MPDAMSAKERWLAALRMEPVDRLPFWPKFGNKYPGRHGAPFSDMSWDAMHDWIGSDNHVAIANCARESRRRASVNMIINNGERQKIYRAPGVEMRLVEHYDEPSDAWHPVEFPVTDVETVNRMAEIYEDVTVELDPDRLRKAEEQQKEIGRSALTTCTIGESPLMFFVEWLAGVENAHYLLMDHRDEVERLFDAMHRVLLKKSEILAERSPADAFYLVENTSTTLISPEQYRQYCARHIGEYAAITKAVDRNLILHMCGHLKALLPDLARIPVQAFEAFTSPSLGNTTLADGRSACPGKCLIGGTNAMLWTRPADEIIGRIEKDLAELPHHRGIVITSAGVMPPICRPETIGEVCDWVKRYPARMD